MRLLCPTPETLHLLLPKDKALYRSSLQGRPPKRVLLVGNGAVEGGWSALERGTGLPPSTNPDTAAALLARFAFRYRRVKNELLIAFNTTGIIPYDRYQAARNDLSTLHEFRVSVATAFNNAQCMKELRLRHCAPVERFLSNPDETGIITTNWDGLLWLQPGLKNVIQLHGLASHPDSLIFPSELSTDEHILELAKKVAKSEDTIAAVNWIEGHYRGEFAATLKAAHELAIDWLAGAEEVMVWGLAVHPYDAELLSVLSSWARSREKRERSSVILVNPNRDHRDRLATVLAAASYLRRDYNPKTKRWVKDV